MARSTEPVTVPLRYPTAAVFIDESGSRASANDFFVMAAVKVRQPGRLARAIREVRDRFAFNSELKFAEITRGSLVLYQELVRILHDSDATLAACVVSTDVHNPFKGRADTWRVHAEVASQLLVGCVNRRELVGVHLDALSTPLGCSLEDTVRTTTNRRLRNTSVVSAVCLDSKCNDLLQIADLLAGSIRHERRYARGAAGQRGNKGKVALRLATAFDRPGLADGRDSRLNIATYRGRGPTGAALGTATATRPGSRNSGRLSGVPGRGYPGGDVV